LLAAPHNDARKIAWRAINTVGKPMKVLLRDTQGVGRQTVAGLEGKAREAQQQVVCKPG